MKAKTSSTIESLEAQLKESRAENLRLKDSLLTLAHQLRIEKSEKEVLVRLIQALQ